MSGKQFNWLKGIVVGSALLLIIVSDVCAESLRVYRGQYVVELPSNSIQSTEEKEADLDAAGADVLRDLGAHARLVGPDSGSIGINSGPEVVEFDPNDTFCVDLLKQGVVESCSPNYEIRVDLSSNDPKLGQLWGMSEEDGIDAPGAWDTTTGSNSVVVAVIDTGVDYNHPDLKGNMWTNPGEIPGNGIDDDGNGYVDDIHGINAINGTGNPLDDNGHGSHCAGTIGGKGNNGTGVVGVNWNVKIMALKFLSASGGGSLSAAIEAIQYMVMMKNRGINIVVANNSWGGGGFSQALMNAVESSHAAGIVFAAAAGNSANDNDSGPHYPSNYEVDNVISVAAIDQNQNLASFSNYGAETVDIAAPGVSILSTTPGNNYQKLSGTSMATPHVTGAIALLAAQSPSLSHTQLIQRLYESGVSSSTLQGVVRTGRKLNVKRMVLNLTSPVPGPNPGVPDCVTSSTAIPFGLDSAVQSSSIVQQADEFSFYTLNLPFTVSFHRQQVSSVKISPNGVIYFGSAPGSADYKPGAAAPINALAALHSDLIAKVDPQGVRVRTTASQAIVYYRVKHYSKQSGGDIHVQATIHASGALDVMLQFDDATVQSYVDDRATIGVTGPKSTSAYTFARNDSKIASGLAVRFTHSCPAVPNASVSSIDLRGKTRRGKLRRKVRRGLKIQASLAGLGTGNIQVYAGFNNRFQCETPFTVAMHNGSAQFETAIPRNLPDKFREIRFSSGSISQSIRFQGARASRRRARNRRVNGQSLSVELRERKVQRFCNKLAARLAQL